MRDVVYKKRLLFLCDFLERLPNKKFNFGYWIDNSSWRGLDIPTAVKIDNLFHKCGTTGCAMGWACMLPKFKRLGLRMGKAAPHIKGQREVDEYGSSGTLAIQQLFGVSKEEASYMFVSGQPHPEDAMGDTRYSPDSDASAKQVARHLRKFAKEKWG